MPSVFCISWTSGDWLNWFTMLNADNKAEAAIIDSIYTQMCNCRLFEMSAIEIFWVVFGMSEERTRFMSCSSCGVIRLSRKCSWASLDEWEHKGLVSFLILLMKLVRMISGASVIDIGWLSIRLTWISNSRFRFRSLKSGMLHENLFRLLNHNDAEVFNLNKILEYPLGMYLRARSCYNHYFLLIQGVFRGYSKDTSNKTHYEG